MKRKAMLAGLVGVWAATACGSVITGHPITGSAIPFPEDGSIPTDMNVRLSRSACYGTCPVYTLTVVADGTVKFNGKEFTETIGRAQGRVDEEQLKALLQEFKVANFFDLDDEYTSGSCKTDHPTVSTTLTINGADKTIEHDKGCDAPDELSALERRIDDIVGSDRWVGE